MIWGYLDSLRSKIEKTKLGKITRFYCLYLTIKTHNFHHPYKFNFWSQTAQMLLDAPKYNF